MANVEDLQGLLIEYSSDAVTDVSTIYSEGFVGYLGKLSSFIDNAGLLFSDTLEVTLPIPVRISDNQAEHYIEDLNSPKVLPFSTLLDIYAWVVGGGIGTPCDIVTRGGGDSYTLEDDFGLHFAEAFEQNVRAVFNPVDLLTYTEAFSASLRVRAYASDNVALLYNAFVSCSTSSSSKTPFLEDNFDLYADTLDCRFSRFTQLSDSFSYDEFYEHINIRLPLYLYASDNISLSYNDLCSHKLYVVINPSDTVELLDNVDYILRRHTGAWRDLVTYELKDQGVIKTIRVTEDYGSLYQEDLVGRFSYHLVAIDDHGLAYSEGVIHGSTTASYEIDQSDSFPITDVIAQFYAQYIVEVSDDANVFVDTDVKIWPTYIPINEALNLTDIVRARFVCYFNSLSDGFGVSLVDRVTYSFGDIYTSPITLTDLVDNLGILFVDTHTVRDRYLSKINDPYVSLMDGIASLSAFYYVVLEETLATLYSEDVTVFKGLPGVVTFSDNYGGVIVETLNYVYGFCLYPSDLLTYVDTLKVAFASRYPSVSSEQGLNFIDIVDAKLRYRYQLVDQLNTYDDTVTVKKIAQQKYTFSEDVVVCDFTDLINYQCPFTVAYIITKTAIDVLIYSDDVDSLQRLHVSGGNDNVAQHYDEHVGGKQRCYLYIVDDISISYQTLVALYTRVSVRISDDARLYSEDFSGRSVLRGSPYEVTGVGVGMVDRISSPVLRCYLPGLVDNLSLGYNDDDFILKFKLQAKMIDSLVVVDRFEFQCPLSLRFVDAMYYSDDADGYARPLMLDIIMSDRSVTALSVNDHT